MKIKINEFENHNIEFPDEIDGNRFASLIFDRLVPLAKFIQKDDFLDVPKKPIKEIIVNKSKPTLKRSATREEIIHILKVHYSPLPKEKKKEIYAKFEGISPHTLIYNHERYMQSRKITPQEVGLKKMPNQTEYFHLENFRLSNNPDYSLMEIPKVNIQEDTKVPEKKYRESLQKRKPTREEVVEILKIYYSGKSRQEKEKLWEKYKDVNPKTYYNGAKKTSKRFNITPQEVGMIKFPEFSELGMIDSLRIKNE
jgi:hypothetical protein